MILASGRTTCGTCIELNLFSHGVSNLMQFCIFPVFVMTYIGLLLGGLPLKLLHSLVFWIKFSDTLVLLLLLIKR